MELIKDFLFNILIRIGLVAIIVTFIWWILKLLNRIFKVSKYLIMYHAYKRKEELYDMRNKLIVAKDGHVSYSCVGNMDELIEILNKGIEYANQIKELRERLSGGD